MDRNRRNNLLLAVSVAVMLAIYVPRYIPHRGKTPVQSTQAAAKQTERFKRFKKQADDGDLDAQLRLAWMYKYGRGVDANAAESTRLYKLAVDRLRASADRGVVDAQVKLAEMYKDGTGVDRDLVQAGDLFRKAANGGNPRAQYSLGLMYNAGVGLPLDYVEAYKWYLVAAENGDPEATGSLEMVAAHMKPEHVTLGRKRADDFLAKQEAKK